MADLRIAWVQSADDPTLGGDVVAYELARQPVPNPVAVVATIPAAAAAGDTVYQEAVPAGTWHYRVRAVDGAGRRSVWSEQAVVQVAFTVTIHHDFIAVLPREPRVVALRRESRIARAIAGATS